MLKSGTFQIFHSVDWIARYFSITFSAFSFGKLRSNAWPHSQFQHAARNRPCRLELESKPWNMALCRNKYVLLQSYKNITESGIFLLVMILHANSQLTVIWWRKFHVYYLSQTSCGLHKSHMKTLNWQILYLHSVSLLKHERRYEFYSETLDARKFMLFFSYKSEDLLWGIHICVKSEKKCFQSSIWHLLLSAQQKKECCHVFWPFSEGHFAHFLQSQGTRCCHNVCVHVSVCWGKRFYHESWALKFSVQHLKISIFIKPFPSEVSCSWGPIREKTAYIICPVTRDTLKVIYKNFLF